MYLFSCPEGGRVGWVGSVWSALFTTFAGTTSSPNTRKIGFWNIIQKPNLEGVVINWETFMFGTGWGPGRRHRSLV